MATSRSATTADRLYGTAVTEDLAILEATIDALTSAMPIGMGPDKLAKAGSRFARALFSHPRAITRQTIGLTGELLKIAAGASEIDPASDRRFGDETYTSHPLYKRIAQSYLATDRALHELIDGLDLDERTRLRAVLATNIVTSTLAPTNTLLGNPAALKRAQETKGQSLLDGARHAAHDIRHNGAMPSMVDTRPFVHGETIAATPGAVVFSNPVLELIQYTPTTTRVGKRPLVILPPQINKYYVLDLAPQRSMIEHLVGQGQQVFCVSWRNATPEHREWNLDTYLTAALDGIDAATEITGSPDVNLLGVCAGGITSAALVGHLAAIGDTRVNSASFLVTVLDWEVPSTIGGFVSPALANMSRRMSRRKGVLSGEELGKLFAWLRPNDLIWNYWVNNYLMGKNPPEFDVLAWNGDSTNLPAELHADFLDMASKNALAKAGMLQALDTPVDLHQVTCDTFVVGAETDHITPWKACYSTVNFVGGTAEFVLSSQGHIQALVNPSGNPKGRYFTNADAITSAEPLDADTWLEGATQHQGSWWDHWSAWLAERDGGPKAAPKKLGSTAHPTLMAAPGSYILG